MDALSAAASITALVGTCCHIARALNDVRLKFGRADMTVAAIATECAIMSTTLAQVARVINRDPESSSSKLAVNVGSEAMSLDLVLQSAIDSCMMIMAILQQFLDKCNEKNSSGAASWSSKMKYIWNEGEMENALETIRRLQQSIGTLLTVMQT